MSYLQLLTPFFLLITFVGLIRLRRCRGFWMPCAGLIAFTALSWPPLSWLLCQPLERPYRNATLLNQSVDAIVVPAAGFSPAYGSRPFPLPDRESLSRCERAAILHRQWPSVPVYASGGTTEPERPTFAALMKELLRRAGIPDTMIITEERSRNTHENAEFTASLLREHGARTIALVTEATSMLRAEGCFRHEGLNVVPVIADAAELDLKPEALLPTWKAMKRNEDTLHEVLGYFWYRLKGWV